MGPAVEGYARPMKKLLVAMALGGALAYFFDPANGTQRRTSLQRRLDQGSGVATPTPVRPVAVADEPVPHVSSVR